MHAWGKVEIKVCSMQVIWVKVCYHNEWFVCLAYIKQDKTGFANI